MSRSRIVPRVQKLIQRIDDSVLRHEAIRLATTNLDVDASVLQVPNRQAPARTSGSFETPGAKLTDPFTEAGATVLTLVLTRPDLTAPLLREGLHTPALERPLRLGEEDFREEAHRTLFTLLGEHAGEDLDGVLSDERARPLMDQIGALASQGERLYPSESSVREAWLRLAILSREHKKRKTPDYDQKELLRTEIQELKRALSSVSAGA